MNKASTSCSVSPATMCSAAWSSRSPTKCACGRAEAGVAVIRRYTETRYGAKSWQVDRRVAARIEATAQGLDIRYVVTSFTHGSAEWLYRLPLLRPRSGREPDQVTQEPACLRPHQLPFASRQSGASRAAHRRLL